MTQEELDALMGGDELVLDEEIEEIQEDEEVDDANESESLQDDKEKPIAPPVVTEDNKIVDQLDQVTKDSEEKATEIFDRLDGIGEYISNVEQDATQIALILEENKNLFEKLCNRFDDVEVFKESLEKNSVALSKLKDIVEKSQMSSDEIMMIMDTMQYQDIHRQKIERVINVMRSLLRYMNTLFGSDIKDEDRVSSAQHIEGDKDTGEVVSNEDIEALLNSFGN